VDLHAFVPDSTSLAPTADDGPLHGLDVAVKDLFAVRGRISSFGHPVWRPPTAPPSGMLTSSIRP
jgi:Asp-tRNA(Asn)/Glu-tRNA(Gln) amidotransferase A subunit family amidase